MRVLIFNGSPKREQSRTLEMTRRFLEGLSDNAEISDLETDCYHLADAKIEDCTGCFKCWEKGRAFRCVYRDDMDTLLPLYETADLVIWSFPLYFFLPPANVIRFQQRVLPIMHPSIIEKEKDRYGHPYNNSFLENRLELFFVSGGLPSYKNNFECVDTYTKLYRGKQAQHIFLPQSESTNKEYLRKKVERFRRALYEAGKSFSPDRGISEKWTKKLDQRILMDPAQYLEISNRYLATK